MNPTAAAAIRLLALTGCRKNEIVALRWAEVDLPGRALRLAESKEGASVRALGGAAAALLASLSRDRGEFVFPGERRELPFGGIDRAWDSVMRHTALPGVTPHTLRHSFASVAGDLGYTESTIGAMLGHAAGSVTGRYTHHLDVVLAAAADRVAGEISAYMLREISVV